LPRHVHKTRIHQLAFLGQQPLRLQLLRELFKELLEHSHPHERLAEVPERIGVGHLVGHRPAHKLLESQPITNLILRLFIRQIVIPLHHQQLEHLDRVIGRTPARPLGRFGQGLRQQRAETLPIDQASNRLNGLPLASSHCTRSSTSKNPSVCAD